MTGKIAKKWTFLIVDEDGDVFGTDSAEDVEKIQEADDSLVIIDLSWSFPEVDMRTYEDEDEGDNE